MPEQRGMGQRCHTTRLVDPCDHLIGRGPTTRYEGRAPTRKPAIEGVPGVGYVPARHEGPCNRGTTDRLGIGQSRSNDGFAVERNAVAHQPLQHLLDANNSVAALLGQKGTQPLRSRIDEVAEHMDIDLICRRRDLDARDELDPGAEARSGRRLARRHRVVVGHAQHRDARRG